MKAHIISIGDELLIGQTINSNASYIGELLTGLQIQVAKISVVGDNEEDILSEFQQAYSGNDLVVVTGGLGVTHDDITRKVVCNFFKCGLIKNQEVLDDITERFERLNHDVSKINEDQSYVPEVASALRNMIGTAPGYWIEKDNKIFVVLPGVPHEMKNLMKEVVSKLEAKEMIFESYTATVNLLTTGIWESTLYEKFGDIEKLLDGGKLAFLPSPFGVKLRISASGNTKENAESKLSEIEQRIRAIAGRYIYGKNDDDLAEVVGRLLKERGITISVAESCTGGLIAHRITSFSGSSDYFERGVISYSNASKVEVLGVDEDTIANFGAVSPQVACQMAQGIRSISGTEIGIGVTGIMGPTGGSAEKPIGLVYIGYADSKITESIELRLSSNRILNKERAAQAAFSLVRKMILGISLDA